MALCATTSYYDINEITTQILPNVVVLTIDPDSDVRSKSFQAVEQFLQIVKQYHELELQAQESLQYLEMLVYLVMESPSKAPAWVNSSTDLADQPVLESPTSTDGWGEIENGIHEEQGSDKDGWDDIEPLEEPKAYPALESIQATRKWSVSQPVSQ